MSGSPIYIDGKMIGAYAYGWSFGKEPVAGVTPIDSMLEDLERPLPKSIFGWPLDPLPAPQRAAQHPEARLHANDNPSTRYTGNIADYHLDDHAAELRERSSVGKLFGASGVRREAGALRPVATPILLGGMGE